MTHISLRPATLEDLPVLFEFEQGVISAERPFDPTLKEGHINYYDVKAVIESKDAELIVAHTDDEIIASAFVRIKTAKPYLKFGHYAYVGFVYVKPGHRGEGICQQVIEKLVLWAKSRDLNEIRLDVYEDNLNAVRAYEKMGFKKNLVEMRMTI